MKYSPNLLKEIALGLTILTGETVQTDITDYFTDYLNLQSGGIYGINTSTQDRLHIFASCPPGTFYVRNAPDITASNKRTPEAIARDIYRRLHPAALEYWQLCHKAQEAYNKRAAGVQEALKQLAPYCTSLSLDNEKDSATIRGTNFKASVYCYQTGEVHNLEIHNLSVIQAIKVFEALKD